MYRLLIFFLILWIANKLFRTLLPASKKSHGSTIKNKPIKSRQNMDIQDGEFEDVE